MKFCSEGGCRRPSMVAGMCGGHFSKARRVKAKSAVAPPPVLAVEPPPPRPVLEEMPEGMVDSGVRCSSWHPVWIVSEGYGLCYSKDRAEFRMTTWSPWRFSPPLVGRDKWHELFLFRGETRDPSKVVKAWVGASSFYTKDEALAAIEADEAAHRAFWETEFAIAEEVFA